VGFLTNAGVLIRGGGDLASGVALRLARCGMHIVITELAQPLAVRRKVSFAEAVRAGTVEIEGIRGCLVSGPAGIAAIWKENGIAVIVDPDAEVGSRMTPIDLPVEVDARMLKVYPARDLDSDRYLIGLGPGSIPGRTCHVAVETQRGPQLGRVLPEAPPLNDTGTPSGDPRRVMRAPADGILVTHAEIGDRVCSGQAIAEVVEDATGEGSGWRGGHAVSAPFDGLLRGLLPAGYAVKAGLKIGDIDPRQDPELAFLVSEKSLAVGGGVLEAILSRPAFRGLLRNR